MTTRTSVGIAVCVGMLFALLSTIHAPAGSAEVSRWFFTNQLVGGAAAFERDFGSTAGAEFLVGDWDGNGIDDLAMRRGKEFTLFNIQTRATSNIAYGKAGDEVFVGDWDGNGTDTLAVRRGKQFFVKNSVSSGPADAVISYGKAGDEVFVGDWDGNGTDTFAVRRGNVFFARNSLTSGPANVIFAYGRASDTVMVGDWDGNRTDTFAVRRGNGIYLRNDFLTAPASLVFGFGKATDDLFPGDWDGDGADTFVVRRSASSSSVPGSWPGPNNTGVVNESVLSPSGSLTVTQNGAVVENLRVAGQITVKADNVTIRNVYIDGAAEFGIKVDSETSGTVIEDVTIVGRLVGGSCDVGIVWGHFTARRVDISGCGDGIRAGSNTVFEYNWIHDMRDLSIDHSDGVQSVGGTNIVLRGNNIEMDPGMTSAMLLHAHIGGDLRNMLIEGNRVAGGGYTLNIKHRTDTVSNVTVRDNVFVRNSWHWGPILGDAAKDPNVTAWTGNTYDDGSPLNQ